MFFYLKNGKDNSIEMYARRELKVLRCGKIKKDHFQIKAYGKKNECGEKLCGTSVAWCFRLIMYATFNCWHLAQNV